MIVTHKLKLDLTNWEVPPRIDVMQGDKYSRNLEIQLYENSKVLPLSEISNVLIRYVKPDRTGGTYDTLPDGTSAWSIHENALQIAIAPQVCTASGIVQMVVCICSGDAELNSFLLELQVQKLPKGICSSQPYVNIKGFVPQPESAQVGQYLKVKEVDQFGKVTAVETAEGGSGAAPANVVTCILEGGTEDESIIPLNADTLGGKSAVYFTPAHAFCNVVFPADLTLTSTEYTSWPMTIELQGGGYFDIENGRLLCKKACIVEISAAIYLYSGFNLADVVYMGFFHNEGLIARQHIYIPKTDPYITANLNTKAFYMYPGDTLDLRLQNIKGARGLIKNYSTTSYGYIRVLGEGGAE